MEQNRYFLFAGMEYYSAHGWDDFISAHATLDEARAAAALALEDDNDWWHIVDLVTMQIVDEGAAEWLAEQVRAC